MSVAFFENSITGPIFVARFWTFFRTVLDARLRTFLPLFCRGFCAFFAAVLALILAPFWFKKRTQLGPKNGPEALFSRPLAYFASFFLGVPFHLEKKIAAGRSFGGPGGSVFLSGNFLGEPTRSRKREAATHRWPGQRVVDQPASPTDKGPAAHLDHRGFCHHLGDLAGARHNFFWLPAGGLKLYQSEEHGE